MANFAVIDQSLALKVEPNARRVECAAKLRVRLDSVEQRVLRFNLVQSELLSYSLHSFQLHNPTRNKTKRTHIDGRLQCEATYLAPNEQVALRAEVLGAATAHTIGNYRELEREIALLEESGFFALRWEPIDGAALLKRLSTFYARGYRLYFTLETRTALSNPQGAVLFHGDAPFFVKTGAFASARNLFPCRDGLGERAHFSAVRVTAPAAMQVVCSGTLERQLLCGELRSWLFRLDRELAPAHLGVVVGPLCQTRCGTFARRLFSVRPIENAGEALAFLKRTERLFLNLDDATDVVLIPGIARGNVLRPHRLAAPAAFNPLFFSGFFIAAAERFLDPRYLEARAVAAAELLRAKYFAQLVDRSAVGDQSGLWVWLGLAAFFDDLLVNYLCSYAAFSAALQRKRETYFRAVEEGFDVHALAAPLFAAADDCYALPTFALKANLVFWVLCAPMDLNKSNYYTLFRVFERPLAITQKSFYRSLKQVFNRGHFARKLRSYTDFSGTLQLELRCAFNRRDNRVQVRVTQRPLSRTYFEAANARHAEREQYLARKSAAARLRDAAVERLAAVATANRHLLRKELPARDFVLLADAERRTLRPQEFDLQYIVAEAVDGDFQEEVGEMIVRERGGDVALALPPKFHRTNAKKDGESDAGGEEPNEQLSLRLSFDPFHHTLFRIRTGDWDRLLLHHFDACLRQSSDTHKLLSIMQPMNDLLNERFITAFCGYLNERDVPLACKLGFVEALARVPSELSNGRVVDTLSNLLFALKFDADGSVRPNAFRDHEAMAYLLSLLDCLGRCDGALLRAKGRNDDALVQTMLTLLARHDGGELNDNFYQSFLLRRLFKTVAPNHFEAINREALRLAKIVFYNEPFDVYLVTVLFRYWAPFVVRHLRPLRYDLRVSPRTRFSSLAIFAESETLRELLSFFRRLRKRYRANCLVAPALLRHKLFVREHVRGCSLWDLLAVGAGLVARERRFGGSLLANALFCELGAVFTRRRAELRRMQISVSSKTGETVVALIWKELSCGAALASPFHRAHYAQLFALLFDDFAPTFLAAEQAFLFRPDPFFLEVGATIVPEQWLNRERRTVCFKHISLQRKTKRGEVIPLHQNHEYNIRHILQQNIHLSRETYSTKSMQKVIVKILREEKVNSQVERQWLYGEASKGEASVVLRPDLPTLADVRLRLARPEVLTLQQFKEDLFAVIDAYRLNDFIDDAVYAEYIQFIALLVTEADKILKEKDAKEEEQKRHLKIKLQLKTTVKNARPRYPFASQPTLPSVNNERVFGF